MEMYLLQIHSLIQDYYKGGNQVAESSDYEAMFSILLDFFNIKLDDQKKSEFLEFKNSISEVFSEIRKMQYDLNSKEDQQYSIIELKELQQKLSETVPNFKFDLIKFFEQNLVERRVYETSRIKMQVNVFLKSLKIIDDKLDDKHFLNLFLINTILSLKETLVAYPTLDFNLRIHFTISRNRQRYEQCIDLIEKQFPFIFPRFIDKVVNSKDLQEIKKSFELSKKIANNLISNEVSIEDDEKTRLLEKLNSISMVTDFQLKSVKIDQFSELMISYENRSLFEMSYYGGILKKQFENTLTYSRSITKFKRFPTLKFLISVNYPYFHSERPNYMKYSIFGIKMLKSILDHIEFTNFNLPLILYNYYVNSKEYETDLNLPGFSYNKTQLFWLTLAHSNCAKSKSSADQLASEFVDKYFMSLKEFHESFGCNFPKINDKEILSVSSQFMEFSLIYKRNLNFLENNNGKNFDNFY